MKKLFTIITCLTFLLPFISKAQAPIEMQLTISPNISPYIADWETDSESVQLMVMYFGQEPLPVVMQAQLLSGSGVVVAQTDPYRTNPITLTPGDRIFYPQDIMPFTSLQIHPDFEQIIQSTGRLPEDEYEICVTLLSASGSALTPPSCGYFFAQGFEPPQLVLPYDGAQVPWLEASNMIFQWTPILPEPPFSVNYVFSMSEVMEGQDPREAIENNPPIFTRDLYNETQLFFSFDAEGIIPAYNAEGQAFYVWTVTATNPTGQPVTDQPVVPFMFSVTAPEEVCSCTECTFTGISLYQGDVVVTPTSRDPAVVGQVLTFRPNITTDCPPECPLRIEGTFTITITDANGKTIADTTLENSELINYRPRRSGNLTITFTGTAYCEDQPCPCSGSVSRDMPIAPRTGPPGETIPGDDVPTDSIPGETQPPRDTTPPPGDDTEPPGEDIETPPDTFPIPPEEDPPHTIIDRCENGIRLDAATPVSLGARLFEAGTFQYPRAVPIQAEAHDFDLVYFHCDGCESNTVESKEVRDRITNFEWLLKGKGSLNAPLDAQRIRAIDDMIKRILQQLKDLQEAISEMEQKLLDAPDEIHRNKERARRQLADVELRLTELDSTIALWKDSLFTLDTLTTSAVTSIDNLIENNDSLQTDTTRLQDSIQAMTDRLEGKPTAREKALLTQVDQLRRESNLADSLAALKQQEILDEAKRLKLAIADAQQELKAVTETYKNLKSRAEELTQAISELENQRFRRTGASSYYRNQSIWTGTAGDFIDVYFSDDPTRQQRLRSLLDSVNMWAQLVVSTSNPNLKDVRLQAFRQMLDKFQLEAQTACASLPDPQQQTDCGASVSVMQSTTNDYREAIENTRTQRFTIDPRIQHQIDSLQQKLADLEAPIRAAAQTVESQSTDYENSIEEYITTIEQLEAEQIALAETAGQKRQQLAARQATYKSLKDSLELDLEQNRETYVQQLQEWKNDKDQGAFRIFTNLDSLGGLHQDTLAYGIAEADLKIRAENDSIEQARLERLKANLEAIIGADSIGIIRELERQLDSLNEERDDLRDELARLEAEKSKFLDGQKTATGPIVYYIPPPLEELLRGADKQRFEELKAAVLKAEGELEIAYAEKAAIQKRMVLGLEKIARELVRYKQSEDLESGLQEEKSELESQLAELKGELKLDKQKEQEKLDRFFASADSALAVANPKIASYEADSARLAEEIGELKPEVFDQENLVEQYRKDILPTQESQKRFQETQLENIRLTVRTRSESLAQAREELRQLQDDIGRAQATLARANKGDDEGAKASARQAVQQLETDIQNKKTQIEDLQADLQSSRQSLESLQQAFNNADSSLLTAQGAALRARKIADSLWTELQMLNEDLKKVLEELRYWRMVKRKAEALKKKADKARQQFSRSTDELVNEDDQVKSLEAALESVKKALDEAGKAKEKAGKDSKSESEKMSEDEEKAKEKVEDAKAELDSIEQVLRDFLVEKFNTVRHEVQIQITAINDPKLDGWRSIDPDVDEIFTLKYPGDRTPEFNGKPAVENRPPVIKTYGICQVDVLFDPGAGASVPPPTPGVEPRSIALIYKDGEPLWPEWPVIPQGTPRLARDVVPATALGTDSDLKQHFCNTVAEDCQAPPPLIDAIAGRGTYNFSEGGRYIGHQPWHWYVLWEPADVSDNLCAEPKKMKVEYTAIEIEPDDPAENESLPPVKAGILIETPDSLRGAPKSKVEVPARVVKGNHEGLQGEKVLYRVKLVAGEAEDYGFNGTQKEVVEKTNGKGYTKPKFNFGKGFARFEITVKWFRADTCEARTIDAMSPLYLDFIRLGSSPPTFAWEAAKKVYEGASASSATSDFPDSKDTAAYEREIHGVAGLLDYEKDYVNEDSIYFESLSDTIEIDPEGVETELFGIGRTVVQNPPEPNEHEDKSKMEIKVQASCRDTLQPVCFPPTEEASYNTSKIKKFKIGAEGQEFVILVDEGFSPGEPVSGEGKIELNDLAGMVIGYLVDLSLSINEVEVSEEMDPECECPVAKTGEVSWAQDGLVSFTLVRTFDITLDSLVIKAELGAGIGGAVNHAKLPNAVNYYAELDCDGNFLGSLTNFPELEIADFRLKEGASFTFDMSMTKSAAPMGDDFMGILIHSASLEFPQRFTQSEEGQRTTLTAKDFAVGSGGLHGQLTLEGEGLKIGYGGFGVELTSLSVSFDNSELTGAAIGGAMELPAPVDGRIEVEIGKENEEWFANFSNTNPIYIPQLGMTCTLRDGTGLSYNESSEVGTLRLNMTITTEKTGTVSVDNFEVNSNGDVKADAIRIDKEMAFSGFHLHVNTIKFAFTAEQTLVELDGGFGIPGIGIKELNGIGRIESGPTLSVELTGGEIEFDYGGVYFLGAFEFTTNEFRGEFAIGLLAKAKKGGGIRGLVIAGNIEETDTEAGFSYWYAELELTIPTGIPLGQTGVSLLGLGGGVGYNYDPPIGNQEGAPRNTDAFSFKASVTLGNTPRGELLAGRITMVLVSGRFSLNGRVWLLQMEENLFGEGQLNVYWAPEEKLDGYIRMFVGLPDAEGGILQFNGQLNFAFPADPHYVWSEQIEGSAMGLLEANASFIFSEDFVHFDGTLGYRFNDRIPLAVVDILVDLGVSVSAEFDYRNSTSSFSAQAAFRGWWDVDIDAGTFGTHDLISGSVTIQASIQANPQWVALSGKAAVSWDFWFSSGSENVDVSYGFRP